MKRILAGTIGIILLFVAANISYGLDYTYMDYSSNGTAPYGISSDGSMTVGYYTDSDGQARGYLLKGTTFVPLPYYPGALWDMAYGVNNAGTIVGVYYGEDQLVHGYSLAGTTYTPIDYPGASTTWAYGINNAGTIVGFYIDASGTHGFSLNGTAWAPLDYPGATSTRAHGINDGGTIVGYYKDISGTSHGFSFDGNAWSNLDYPGAPDTRAHGINNPGVIAGAWYEGAVAHGFSLNGTAWTALDYQDADSTWGSGIDHAGTILGRYMRSNEIHGFLATPGAMSVEIDIRPWTSNNIISYRDWGLLPVAILSNIDFDALEMMNLKTITLGHEGDENSMAFCSPWEWDVNRDGYQDLICLFWIRKAAFRCGDTEGILRGITQGGVAVEGRNPVKIIPCK